MAERSPFINWDPVFNLSNNDLENLIFNDDVCHLGRISLMMLSSSPNTHPDGPLQLSLDPDPALNILSNEMEKSNCIHHYLPLFTLKFSRRGKDCKFSKFARTTHRGKLPGIHRRQFVTITCQGNVLFQKITNILFSILCKVSHSMSIVNFNNVSQPDVAPRHNLARIETLHWAARNI